MSQGHLTESITRSLAYMLRHQPDEFDLELDEHGYGELGEVIHALNERLGEPIEEDDVVEAIESGDRRRYEIVDDRIRALYGHSFSIDPGEPAEPPELLYVGVGSRDADRAEEHGLRGGRRAFLHLALTYEDAREMGRRIAPEYAVVTVRARDAWGDDVLFYDRVSLFLSEEISTDHLEVGDVQTDGIRRERRGGRSERGGRDRDQSRSRVRGRAGREDARDDHRDSQRDSQRDRRPSPPREERVFEAAPAERVAEAPEPAPVAAPAAPAAPAAQEQRRQPASSGFGVGLADSSPAAVEAAPKSEPKRKPEPKPEPKHEAAAPQPEGGERESEPSPGGFGAGL